MAWPAIAGDGRFFARVGPHALATLAEAANAVLAPDVDGARLIAGVAPLQTAGPDELSFLDNRRYASALEASKAGAVIVHPEMADRVPAGCMALPTTEPYLAWARVAALFHPVPPVQAGVHPSAVIDATAIIDPTAEIGPFVVIGRRVEIGARTRIDAGTVIGEGVLIGPDCRIGAHVTISHTLIGARVCLYPGVRLGQDGFGFATGPRGFVSVPQLGRVAIEDDVEIGANTTIDRGSAHDTVIGAGSRIDNLVQIGHNVQLGRCCVIVAQVGISGSTVFEDFVVVAGQAGFAGHLRIGTKARIGAQAGVIANVPAGADYVGSPAQPAKAMFRQVAVLKRLAARTPASGNKPTGQTDSD